MTDYEKEAWDKIENAIQIVSGVFVLTVCLYCLDEWLISSYRIHARWHLSLISFYSVLLLVFLWRALRDKILD